MSKEHEIEVPRSPYDYYEVTDEEFLRLALPWKVDLDLVPSLKGLDADLLETLKSRDEFTKEEFLELLARKVFARVNSDEIGSRYTRSFCFNVADKKLVDCEYSTCDGLYDIEKIWQGISEYGINEKLQHRLEEVTTTILRSRDTHLRVVCFEYMSGILQHDFIDVVWMSMCLKVFASLNVTRRFKYPAIAITNLLRFVDVRVFIVALDKKQFVFRDGLWQYKNQEQLKGRKDLAKLKDYTEKELIRELSERLDRLYPYLYELEHMQSAAEFDFYAKVLGKTDKDNDFRFVERWFAHHAGKELDNDQKDRVVNAIKYMSEQFNLPIVFRKAAGTSKEKRIPCNLDLKKNGKSSNSIAMRARAKGSSRKLLHGETSVPYLGLGE